MNNDTIARWRKYFKGRIREMQNIRWPDGPKPCFTVARLNESGAGVTPEGESVG